MTEYGQKNISTVKRNLLNKDEVLRLPTNKILGILKGNEPILLDKMRYTEHPLAAKLKDSSIFEYAPTWTKNTTITTPLEKKSNNISNIKKQKITWENF